jgi:hypothetical protein
VTFPYIQIFTYILNWFIPSTFPPLIPLPSLRSHDPLDPCKQKFTLRNFNQTKAGEEREVEGRRVLKKMGSGQWVGKDRVG